LFENLNSKTDDSGVTRFRANLIDMDEVPDELKDPVSKESSYIPINSMKMMEYLPKELKANFESLWKAQHSKTLKATKQSQPMPNPIHTDRQTCSITSKQNVTALAATGIKLKVSEALKSLHVDKWIEAINLEVNSLIDDFKCLVPEEIDYEQEYDCIHATIDLKIKYINEETIDKFKARVCRCGNELVQRSSYSNKTYSPMVSHLTHRTMLQLAVYDKMCVCSIDTVGAFLYQEYPETLKPLYIILPTSVAKACNLVSKTTHRVKKYIYGLPDSGRAYYLAYRDQLLASGYKMTTTNQCLFVRLIDEDNLRTYAWIHVDDTIVTSTHERELDLLKENLQLKFKITTHDLTRHLGINIGWLESGAVKLQQRKLLGALFGEYPPTEKKANQPQRIARNDARGVNEQGDEPCKQCEYLHLLGMLN